MQAFESDIIGQGLMMFTKSLSDYYHSVNFTPSLMPQCPLFKVIILPLKLESFVLYSSEKIPTEIKILPSLFVVFCPFV